MRFLAAFLLLPVLALSAATTKDIEGQWVVDTEATWTMMQENPQMKAQFGSMPPEQQAQIKSMVMAKMAKLTWNLKDGRAEITEPDGTMRTSTWTVTKSEGDTLSIEAKDAQGTATAGTLTIAGDQLIARGFSDAKKPAGQPDTAIVMKRGVAAAPAAK